MVVDLQTLPQLPDRFKASNTSIASVFAFNISSKLGNYHFITSSQMEDLEKNAAQDGEPISSKCHNIWALLCRLSQLFSEERNQQMHPLILAAQRPGKKRHSTFDFSDLKRSSIYFFHLKFRKVVKASPTYTHKMAPATNEHPHTLAERMSVIYKQKEIL